MSEYLEATFDKFTFKVARDRSYSADGVWLQPLGSDRIRVGVADFVQQHSGDLAFASVQPAGSKLTVGEEFATLETVKVNISLPLPIAGVIVEANPALDTRPEVINQDPYGEGWLAVIQAPSWDADRNRLLDADAYFAVMQEQVQQELRQQ
jgi:glycine cleavage system H protein